MYSKTTLRVYVLGGLLGFAAGNWRSCNDFPMFVDESASLGHATNTRNPPPFGDFGQLDDAQRGVAVFDYNNDGLDDALCVSFSEWIPFVAPNPNLHGHRLFKNLGSNSTAEFRFEEVTTEAGLFDGGVGRSGVAAVDFDNDGWIDLVMSGTGTAGGATGLAFFRNDGGVFVDMTGTAIVGPAPSAYASAMLGAGDYDRDGLVDLLVLDFGDLFNRLGSDSRIYRNLGNFTFQDMTLFGSSILPSAQTWACVTGFHDYNEDGYDDIFMGICNDPTIKPTPMLLWKNDGGEQFVDVSNDANLGWAGTILGYSMSTTFADWNGDGRLDLFQSGFGLTQLLGDTGYHGLLLAQGDGDRRTYQQFSEEALLSPNAFGWGSIMADLDNDGWNDLVIQGNFRQINLPLSNSGFVYQSARCTGPDKRLCRRIKRQAQLRQTLGFENDNVAGSAYGDFNGDGWIDFIVSNVNDDLEPVPSDGELKIFRNSGHSCENRKWLQVGLNGVTSNKLGIGSVVRVRLHNQRRTFINQIAGTSSFASTSSRFVHFGFRTRVDTADVEVTWSGSGLVEIFPDVPLDSRVTLTEFTGDEVIDDEIFLGD